MAFRNISIIFFSIVLVLVGVAHGEPQYTATPAVTAGAVPFGGTVDYQEVQYPASPLIVEASSASGGNSAWAQAIPGRLRATSVIANAPNGYDNSQGTCTFVDHFSLVNPAMSNNAKGVFFFRFVLTGTMRILASDPYSVAMFNFHGGSFLNGGETGQINFGRVDGVPTLYAKSGGESHPGDNILAGPNGEIKIFGSTTSQSGGFYEIRVAVPATFIIRDFPINTTPPVDDFYNSVSVSVRAVSFSNASCDFSSTFEFAPQNPIVPDPDAVGMPMTGWDMSAASPEIVLPPVLTVATSTGSGQAAFVAEQGTISNLNALTLADFPEGLTGGDFADGWFDMGISLLEEGGACDVAVTLPAAVGEGATWWFHDGVLWQSIALEDDDGDNRVVLQVVDNGFGDIDPAAGFIYLAGGISDETPLPSFFSLFQAVWRAGAVDLSWRAVDVDPASLKLEAHLDGRAWLVPLTSDSNGDFRARDDAEALYGGGTVRYELSLDGMLLDSREVELPSLATASLDRIAPNPFNPRVEIAFTTSRDAGKIELTIHDLQGCRVAMLVDGDPGPGQHVAEWQGLDTKGQAVPSGTYLVRLATQHRVESRKISLVR